MTLIDHDPNDGVLFPVPPTAGAGALEATSNGDGPSITSNEFYADMLESQCGATDDSQPVEQYDGTLGVTEEFVATYQRPVGQLQWNDDLADVYDNPGNVSSVRWCSGALISESLFLTAGHCFDREPGTWIVPRVDGTGTPIQPEEIARNMHINFDFQVDPDGALRAEQSFAVEELVEYRLGGLDMAVVRLAGKPGKIFGFGRIAADEPPIGDTACIMGHPNGVPKRIEAGPITAYEGDRIRYNDIDTMPGNSGSSIWHAPSGEIVGIHTNGGCQVSGAGSNFGLRVSRLRDVSPTVRQLDARPLLVPAGTYHVRQRSNDRFLDGYTNSNDRAAMTRTAQNNDTQRWAFDPIGMVFSLRQSSSGRYLDAYGTDSDGTNDHSAITRASQDNDTQRWVFVPVPGELATYTVQQLSTGRFLDAHQSAAEDHSAMTRTEQGDDTQRWVVAPDLDGRVTLRQKSSGRLLDAYEGTNDSSAVTRSGSVDDSRRWELLPVGSLHSIQQISSGRFLDAYPAAADDHAVVTRTADEDGDLVTGGQRWVLLHEGATTFRIQQLATRRYLDAQQSSGDDFRAMTRARQDDDTQRWSITPT